MASSRELFTCFVRLRRSYMNNRKRVGDRTESCGTLLLIGLEEEQWSSTTAAMVRKEIRDGAERKK